MSCCDGLVLDGHCRWKSPIYKTVKFHQDVKTGKVNTRIYHLTVSTTGSTKSSLVGETTIDFADYANAANTCNVSLPLQNSNSKATLHVSIQRQLENVEKRSKLRNDSFVKEYGLAPETGCLSVVVLGASGDLAKKKTFPAFINLYRQISLDGITSRDEKVFRFAKEREIPLVMLTSGLILALKYFGGFQIKQKKLLG